MTRVGRSDDGQILSSKDEVPSMPDEVQGDKIKDFGWWIKLKPSELKTEAWILSWKNPEAERRDIAGGFSAQGVDAHYQRELEGNRWQSLIWTPEFGLLPMKTWEAKVESAISQVSGAVQPIVQVTPVPLGNAYRCPHCNTPILLMPASGLCPYCTKKFTI